MRKLSLLLLLCLPILTVCQDFTKEIEALVASKYNNGPAVSVLLSKDFEPTYSLIKGAANIEQGVQASQQSKFRIGSVSKQFTAIAILKLMEAGKLRLSDTIQRFLPHFPVKSHPIRIEHLLTHTSGLAEITEMEVFFEQLMKNGCQPDSLVNYFKDEALEFIPGSQFSYNNSGYHLLGLIIEEIAGVPYNEFILKELLSVAGMSNTTADTTAAIISNRVAGYELVDDHLQNATFIDMSIPFSAGNLLSTAQDLNKWYQALFSYKIVSQASLNKAHTAYQFNDGSLSNYGYGWFVDSLQGEKVVSHEGGINGFLASVWFVPQQNLLTVVLSNCMCNPTYKTAEHITAYGIGKPLAQKKKVDLPRSVLEKYVGTYKMDGELWSVSIKDEALYFQFANGNGHPIYPSSTNEFFAEEWDTKFIFIEKDGKIVFHFIYLDEEIVGEVE